MVSPRQLLLKVAHKHTPHPHTKYTNTSWGDESNSCAHPNPHLSRDSAFSPLIDRVTGLCPALVWLDSAISAPLLEGSLLLAPSLSFLGPGQGWDFSNNTPS